MPGQFLQGIAEMGFYFLPEPVPGTVQFYFYRIGIQAHDPADLFQALLTFVEQVEDLAVIRAKQADRGIQHGMPGFLFDKISPNVRFPAFYLHERFFIVQRGRGQSFLPQEGDAAGADDRIQPGAEFGIAPEIREGAIGFDEDVLADLFGIFPVVGKAQHQGEHIGLIPQDQLGIQGLFALQDSFNNLSISEFFICHVYKTYNDGCWLQ